MRTAAVMARMVPAAAMAATDHTVLANRLRSRSSRRAGVDSAMGTGCRMKPFDIPVKIDRASAVNLTEQLIVGFLNAILSGTVRSGTVLPSRLVLAKGFGVSENVVRAALSRLSEEGLVRSRPRIGCEILHRSSRKVRGRVLRILGAETGAYSSSVFTETMRKELNAAGIRCAYASVQHNVSGKPDYTWLKDELENEPDVAVVEACNLVAPGIVRILESRGLPYVMVFGDRVRTGRHCLASIPYDPTAAVDSFVADCLSARIRSVCKFGFGRGSMLNPLPKLANRGVSVEEITVRLAVQWSLESMQREAARQMSCRLERGPLCDLIFFTDDYLTLGALPVLLDKGIRIPRDVRVVSLANHGFGPVFPWSLTRIESDYCFAARSIARGLVGWIRTGVFDSIDRIEPCYKRGETFQLD